MATCKIRKEKKNFKDKLAHTIQTDTQSFFAYICSKMNVNDKVGPLLGECSNIYTN